MSQLPEDPVEAMRLIQRIREDGEIEAAMSPEPHFVLIAYYALPNGATGDVVSGEDVAAIKERMGLPESGDPAGWAVWCVPDSQGRTDWP